MKRKLIISIALMSALTLLVGCANKHAEQQLQQWSQVENARQQRLDGIAAECDSDLCVVMVAQEANRGATPLPRQQHHPVWNIVDRAIGVAVPAYMGLKQSQAWSDALIGVTGSITSQDRAYTDNSVSIGGDQIGGNRIDDSSSTVRVGGDQISGTLTNDSSSYIGGDSVGGDQWHGDAYTDACVGESCASNSPGPIDNSDNSDNSNNSDNSSQAPAGF